MIVLRDGSHTENPRLDRLVERDERNLGFPIGEVVPEAIRARTWSCAPRLDQGQEGACVGFAWAHELAAQPQVVKGTDAQFARERLYWEAQRIDPWPGGSYPGATPAYEGTSVLAGAKAVAALGLIREYRWAFTTDDILRAISHEGPVVMGSVWYRSMFRPRPSGLLEVDPSSGVAGGHAWLLRGQRFRTPLRGEPRSAGTELVRIRNSWGPAWGHAGDAFLRLEDLEHLLTTDGDACVPIGRTTRQASPST